MCLSYYFCCHLHKLCGLSVRGFLSITRGSEFLLLLGFLSDVSRAFVCTRTRIRLAVMVCGGDSIFTVSAERGTVFLAQSLCVLKDENLKIQSLLLKSTPVFSSSSSLLPSSYSLYTPYLLSALIPSLSGPQERTNERYQFTLQCCM